MRVLVPIGANAVAPANAASSKTTRIPGLCANNWPAASR